jgi:hypothetical protein
MSTNFVIRAWGRFVRFLCSLGSKTGYGTLNTRAKGSVEVTAVGIRAAGGASAVRVTTSEGQTSEADQVNDQLVRYQIKGVSRQGETGVLKVCSILIERLNSLGASWHPPKRPDGPEGGVDCVTTNGSESIEIQVTRAVSNKETWKLLNAAGFVNRDRTVQDAADDLRLAIKKKETMPSKQRMDVLLALDATETSSHTLPAVLDSFRGRYRSEVKALGFKAIWVVGPVVALTLRVDDDETAEAGIKPTE